jgi:competence protein ComEA
MIRSTRWLPMLGLAAALVVASPGAALATAPATAQEKPQANTPRLINLNTATVADLQKLPGVGPAMADRIIEYRQKTGGFKKVEELMNVKGIGEKTFLKLKVLVSVAPPKTHER